MGRRARVHHRPQPDRLHDLRPRGGHRRPERDVGPGSGHLRRQGVQLPRGRARPPVAPGQLPGDSGHRQFARPVRCEGRRQRRSPCRAGRTYVAYFQNAANGYYETPNASRGENPGAEAGWTLGGPYGSRFVHPVGSAGTTGTSTTSSSGSRSTSTAGRTRCRPPRTRLPRRPAPCWSATLGQPSTSTGQLVGKRINLEIAYAASFTNGNDAVHTLHGVQIEVTFIPSPQVLGAIRASIYSDDGGKPGVALHVLGLRASPQVGVLTFEAPATPRLPQTRPSGWSSTLRIRLLRTSSGQPSPPVRGRTPAPSGMVDRRRRLFPGKTRRGLVAPNADLLKDGHSRRADVQRVGRVGRAHLRRPARRHHHHWAPRRRR